MKFQNKSLKYFLITIVFSFQSIALNWSNLSQDEYIEKLVDCQLLIKELQWSRNIWPKENKKPKPDFIEVIDIEQIEKQVVANLRKQYILEAQFGYNITEDILQADLNRMTRDTKDAKALSELFDVLNNDSMTVAQCISRPNLVNNNLFSRYYSDKNIHQKTKNIAESELNKYLRNQNEISINVTSFKTVYALKKEFTKGINQSSKSPIENIIELETEEFNLKIQSFLKSQILQEHETVYLYNEMIKYNEDRIEIKSLVWKKQGLLEWLSFQNKDFSSLKLPTNKYNYKLPEIMANDESFHKGTETITANSWKKMSDTPSARLGHTAVWTGNEMIVWGGADSFSSNNIKYNTGGRYNPQTDTWLETSLINVPSERYFHSSVWTGTEMVVWGGQNRNGEKLNTGGRYNPQLDQWDPTNLDNAPDARWLHSTIWSGNEMMVWGGLGNVSLLNSGGRYNPQTDLWTVISLDSAPEIRSLHTAVWTGTEMIVWGGFNSNSNSIATGGRYNPQTDAWLATSNSSSPEARYSNSAVWTGAEMIVWGGIDNSNNILATGGRYNPQTDVWLATSNSNTPEARYRHTSVWTGVEMLVWGGFVDNLGQATPGGRYDPQTDSWLEIQILGAPIERNRHSAIWTGAEMIVWGGISGSALNTGGRYNPLFNTWSSIDAENPPIRRTGHTAIWTGNEMITWGGSSRSNFNVIYFNTGDRYDPQTDTWLATSTDEAPVNRESHTAIWTGQEMVVWGGYNGNQLNSGGRYNPQANTWVATENINAPSERKNHSSIWTGSELVIWGGISVSGSVNDGGIYDPQTDTWTDMTLLDAPMNRRDPSVIWTGEDMVVWGGQGEGIGNYFNTGGIYNLQSNTWSSTSIKDAPTARYLHTSVWTGDKMIVWGGLNNEYLNTGGIYDPETDIWVDTSLVNVPIGRRSHNVVWSGTEMIIWGGMRNSNLQEYINSGGRYNPQSDSWLAVNNNNAPNKREDSTAVWTGSEMIIWGGFDGAAVNSGGRYNPQKNSWMPTNNFYKTPSSRRNHTSVWTGKEMIVWGGSGSFSSLNTGGLFDPKSDRWEEVTTTGAPAARSYHTAIWTGNEMIIWGGDSTSSDGRYIPSIDAWIPTSTDNAPDARIFHTAIWSGHEMIIWGGDTEFNSGGRYDPLTNSWTATNMVDAPEKRIRHTATWTGNNMIIWGGSTFPDTIIPINNGSRYNPEDDTWNVISTVNAPVDRFSHTAVWTGEGMMVWGGSSDSASNFGSNYDPLTNDWTSISVIDSPNYREDHTAIWTGSEMIVWGGSRGSGINTGGRYNIQSDSWQDTSLLLVPDARFGHTSIWTGAEMIVYGGVSSAGKLDSVGIYYPEVYYRINGSLIGLSSDQVALQNNSGDDLILTNNGEFSFENGVIDGENYNVTVLPNLSDPSQICTVINGEGVVNGGDVIDIVINCDRNFIFSNGFE
jgi:N-acetylneuraminic acid mutarotase